MTPNEPAPQAPNATQPDEPQLNALGLTTKKTGCLAVLVSGFGVLILVILIIMVLFVVMIHLASSAMP